MRNDILTVMPVDMITAIAMTTGTSTITAMDMRHHHPLPTHDLARTLHQ